MSKTIKTQPLKAETSKVSISEKPATFMFGRKNYMIMLIGLGVLVHGFALMTGKENIYDFRKTVLAPILVLVGFAIEFVAILTKNTDKA